MLIITKEFNSLNIRIISDNQELFIAKDVAELLGYSNTRKAIRDHCKYPMTLDELISKRNGSLRFDPVEKLGRNYKNIKVIPESDVWRLIIKSRLPEAEKIEKWITEEVLPSIRKTGKYELEKSEIQETSQQPQPDQNIVNNIFALNNSIEVLRPSQASKISMTEKLYTRLELETCYLPKYTEEKLTRSLTYLLKKYEIKISTQKANLKLLEVGILEKMERDSACGKTKYFWSLTEKGLDFGKNLISPKNERETQPHFFEDKFLELVELF